jgi:hypothetical protein
MRVPPKYRVSTHLAEATRRAATVVRSKKKGMMEYWIVEKAGA